MIAGAWDELVTAAVLGTDRRPPPELPAGPFADLVADAVEPDPARRLLTAIAAVGAARAAAFRPDPAASPPAPPVVDRRPWSPVTATRTWSVIRRDWPLLEDEWIREVVAGGWRLPPDVTVRLLERHRGDAGRRGWVVRAAGPSAGWVADLVPELRARGTRPSDLADATAHPGLPPLPLPGPLAAVLDADAGGVVAAIVAGIDGSGSPAALRPVLVNLVARCRPDVLDEVARRLRATVAPSGWTTTVDTLAELAELRHRMRTELARVPGP